MSNISKLRYGAVWSWVVLLMGGVGLLWLLQTGQAQGQRAGQSRGQGVHQRTDSRTADEGGMADERAGGWSVGSPVGLSVGSVRSSRKPGSGSDSTRSTDQQAASARRSTGGDRGYRDLSTNASKQAIPTVLPSMPVQQINGEPIVRVRVVSNREQVTLDAPGGLWLRPPASLWAQADQSALNVSPTRFTGPLQVRFGDAGFHLTDGAGRQFDWQVPILSVKPVAGQVVQVGRQADSAALVAYPGELMLHAKKNEQTGRFNRLVDVINHVALETYIPGVIQKELYGSWDSQAFRAQAICARSYFFYEAFLNQDRHYDLESTTASQVYTGQAVNPKATAAAQSTRGLVLTYQGRVLPTFYSSTSGGIGQNAFGTFPLIPDVPPLRGFAQGDWGKASTSYQWSFARPTSQLAQRMKAWGQANQHPIAGLNGLTQVQVIQRTPAGRPRIFEVIDLGRRRYTLKAEQLRQACNHQVAGLPEIARAQRMKSSFAHIRVTQTTTRFDGRGFGHGVGMCQWSAQAMAKAGYQAESIVAFFYPGATLKKVY